MAVLNVPSTERRMASYQSKATQRFASLLAGSLILIRWNAACPPSFTRMILEVTVCLKFEKAMFTLNKSPEKHNGIRLPFIDYVRNSSFPTTEVIHKLTFWAPVYIIVLCFSVVIISNRRGPPLLQRLSINHWYIRYISMLAVFPLENNKPSCF